MIVFHWNNVTTRKQANEIIQSQDFQSNDGEFVDIELGSGTLLLWNCSEFMGILDTNENVLKLYGKRRTNAIKVYERKFPNLSGFDHVRVAKFKRWS